MYAHYIYVSFTVKSNNHKYPEIEIGKECRFLRSMLDEHINCKNYHSCLNKGGRKKSIGIIPNW